jgi:hypothetical protein
VWYHSTGDAFEVVIGKATGLFDVPFDCERHNAVWLEWVLAAQDLCCWTRALLLAGPLCCAEPKPLRYQLLHIGAQVTASSSS